jgi:acetyl esterase
MRSSSAGFRLGLERFVVRRLVQLPAWLQTKLSGRPPVSVGGLTLHPEIQLLLAAWKWQGATTLRADTPALARAAFKIQTCRHDVRCDVESVSELTIEGATAPLRARHYAPAASEKGGQPLLVFFHGGGFVLGDLDTHDAPCRLLCKHGAMHVLAIDYRLAPEHPFPAASEDAVAAFRWAALHAEELGADERRVCVGGDSAGGNLSAVVAQQTALSGGPAPAAQLLIYPVVDSVQEWPSGELFASGFVLDHEDRRWFTRQYVSVGVDRADPRLSPFRITNASGLCPAYVVTAGFDPLRDEGEAYADKLAAAGVPTTVRRYDGFVHGFLNMVGVSPASRAAAIEIGTAFGELVRSLDAGDAGASSYAAARDARLEHAVARVEAGER